MPTLQNPLALPCGATLPNRIAKSAMSEDMASAGQLPDEQHIRAYTRWGASGAGLLMSGNVMVDRTALGEPGNVAIEDERNPEAFSAWAAAGQCNGTQFWVQLNHPGRQSPRFLSRQPVAPSAVMMEIPGKIFNPPRELSPEEIVAIISRFGRAAAFCKSVGFAGVQVHGAHGYLVSQFLSPHTNRRTDEWGGSLENRMRFLIGIVRAIRAAVGPDFPVGVKLNSADFQRGGFTEEESMDVVAALEGERIDLLEISGGTYEKPAVTGIIAEVRASTVAREAYFLGYARRVRERTRLPLMLTGGFRTRVGMESAIAEGAIDVVGLARPMALEPDFPARILAGTANDSHVQPRTTGVRQLDGLLEVAWYAHQIQRMGRGLDPDPNAWPWPILAKVGWRSFMARFG